MPSSRVFALLLGLTLLGAAPGCATRRHTPRQDRAREAGPPDEVRRMRLHAALRFREPHDAYLELADLANERSIMSAAEP